MDIKIANLDAVLFSYFWHDIKSVKEIVEQLTLKGAAISKDVDIEPLLNLSYAYGPSLMRATFFSTSENTTIMFPNLQDGWFTLFSTITSKLKAKSCYMKIMDSNKIVDGANYLVYCEGSQERVVYTLKENRWVFWEQGAPQHFENTAYYTAKQKKERLSREIMLGYCENLEITKNGVVTLNIDSAFSYELGNATGKSVGSTSFIRK